MKTLSKSALVEALVSFASSAKEQFVPRMFSSEEVRGEALKVVRAFEASLKAHIWNQIDSMIQKSHFSLDLLADMAERNLRGEAYIKILRAVSPETVCEEELLPKLWHKLSQLVHEADSRPQNSKTVASAAVF